MSNNLGVRPVKLPSFKITSRKRSSTESTGHPSCVDSGHATSLHGHLSAKMATDKNIHSPEPVNRERKEKHHTTHVSRSRSVRENPNSGAISGVQEQQRGPSVEQPPTRTGKSMSSYNSDALLRWLESHQQSLADAMKRLTAEPLTGADVNERYVSSFLKKMESFDIRRKPAIVDTVNNKKAVAQSAGSPGTSQVKQRAKSEPARSRTTFKRKEDDRLADDGKSSRNKKSPRACSEHRRHETSTHTSGQENIKALPVTVEHILPKRHGELDSADNYTSCRTRCGDSNKRKSKSKKSKAKSTQPEQAGNEELPSHDSLDSNNRDNREASQHPRDHSQQTKSGFRFGNTKNKSSKERPTVCLGPVDRQPSEDKSFIIRRPDEDKSFTIRRPDEDKSVTNRQPGEDKAFTNAQSGDEASVPNKKYKQTDDRDEVACRRHCRESQEHENSNTQVRFPSATDMSSSGSQTKVHRRKTSNLCIRKKTAGTRRDTTGGGNFFQNFADAVGSQLSSIAYRNQMFYRFPGMQGLYTPDVDLSSMYQPYDRDEECEDDDEHTDELNSPPIDQKKSTVEETEEEESIRLESSKQPSVKSQSSVSGGETLSNSDYDESPASRTSAVVVKSNISVTSNDRSSKRGTPPSDIEGSDTPIKGQGVDTRQISLTSSIKASVTPDRQSRSSQRDRGSSKLLLKSSKGESARSGKSSAGSESKSLLKSSKGGSPRSGKSSAGSDRQDGKKSPADSKKQVLSKKSSAASSQQDTEKRRSAASSQQDTEKRRSAASSQQDTEKRRSAASSQQDTEKRRSAASSQQDTEKRRSAASSQQGTEKRRSAASSQQDTEKRRSAASSQQDTEKMRSAASSQQDTERRTSPAVSRKITPVVKKSSERSSKAKQFSKRSTPSSKESRDSLPESDTDSVADSKLSPRSQEKRVPTIIESKMKFSKSPQKTSTEVFETEDGQIHIEMEQSVSLEESKASTESGTAEKSPVSDHSPRGQSTKDRSPERSLPGTGSKGASKASSILSRSYQPSSILRSDKQTPESGSTGKSTPKRKQQSDTPDVIETPERATSTARSSKMQSRESTHSFAPSERQKIQESKQSVVTLEKRPPSRSDTVQPPEGTESWTGSEEIEPAVSTISPARSDRMEPRESKQSFVPSERSPYGEITQTQSKLDRMTTPDSAHSPVVSVRSPPCDSTHSPVVSVRTPPCDSTHSPVVSIRSPPCDSKISVAVSEGYSTPSSRKSHWSAEGQQSVIISDGLCVVDVDATQTLVVSEGASSSEYSSSESPNMAMQWPEERHTLDYLQSESEQESRQMTALAEERHPLESIHSIPVDERSYPQESVHSLVVSGRTPESVHSTARSGRTPESVHSTARPGRTPESVHSTARSGRTPESVHSTARSGRTPESVHSTARSGRTPESVHSTARSGRSQVFQSKDYLDTADRLRETSSFREPTAGLERTYDSFEDRTGSPSKGGSGSPYIDKEEYEMPIRSSGQGSKQSCRSGEMTPHSGTIVSNAISDRLLDMPASRQSLTRSDRTRESFQDRIDTSSRGESQYPLADTDDVGILLRSGTVSKQSYRSAEMTPKTETVSRTSRERVHDTPAYGQSVTASERVHDTPAYGQSVTASERTIQSCHDSQDSPSKGTTKSPYIDIETDEVLVQRSLPGSKMSHVSGEMTPGSVNLVSKSITERESTSDDRKPVRLSDEIIMTGEKQSLSTTDRQQTPDGRQFYSTPELQTGTAARLSADTSQMIRTSAKDSRQKSFDTLTPKRTSAIYSDSRRLTPSRTEQIESPGDQRRSSTIYSDSKRLTQSRIAQIESPGDQRRDYKLICKRDSTEMDASRIVVSEKKDLGRRDKREMWTRDGKDWYCTDGGMHQVKIIMKNDSSDDGKASCSCIQVCSSLRPPAACVMLKALDCQEEGPSSGPTESGAYDRTDDKSSRCSERDKSSYQSRDERHGLHPHDKCAGISRTNVLCTCPCESILKGYCTDARRSSPAERRLQRQVSYDASPKDRRTPHYDTSTPEKSFSSHLSDSRSVTNQYSRPSDTFSRPESRQQWQTEESGSDKSWRQDGRVYGDFDHDDFQMTPSEQQGRYDNNAERVESPYKQAVDNTTDFDTSQEVFERRLAQNGRHSTTRSTAVQSKHSSPRSKPSKENTLPLPASQGRVTEKYEKKCGENYITVTSSNLSTSSKSECSNLQITVKSCRDGSRQLHKYPKPPPNLDAPKDYKRSTKQTMADRWSSGYQDESAAMLPSRQESGYRDYYNTERQAGSRYSSQASQQPSRERTPRYTNPEYDTGTTGLSREYRALSYTGNYDGVQAARDYDDDIRHSTTASGQSVRRSGSVLPSRHGVRFPCRFEETSSDTASLPAVKDDHLDSRGGQVKECDCQQRRQPYRTPPRKYDTCDDTTVRKSHSSGGKDRRRIQTNLHLTSRPLTRANCTSPRIEVKVTSSRSSQDMPSMDRQVRAKIRRRPPQQKGPDFRWRNTGDYDRESCCHSSATGASTSDDMKSQNTTSPSPDDLDCDYHEAMPGDNVASGKGIMRRRQKQRPCSGIRKLRGRITFRCSDCNSGRPHSCKCKDAKVAIQKGKVRVVATPSGRPMISCNKSDENVSTGKSQMYITPQIGTECALRRKRCLESFLSDSCMDRYEPESLSYKKTYGLASNYLDALRIPSHRSFTHNLDFWNRRNSGHRSRSSYNIPSSQFSSHTSRLYDRPVKTNRQRHEQPHNAVAVHYRSHSNSASPSPTSWVEAPEAIDPFEQIITPDFPFCCQDEQQMHGYQTVTPTSGQIRVSFQKSTTCTSSPSRSSRQTSSFYISSPSDNGSQNGQVANPEVYAQARQRLSRNHMYSNYGRNQTLTDQTSPRARPREVSPPRGQVSPVYIGLISKPWSAAGLLRPSDYSQLDELQRQRMRCSPIPCDHQRETRLMVSSRMPSPIRLIHQSLQHSGNNSHFTPDSSDVELWARNKNFSSSVGGNKRTSSGSNVSPAQEISSEVIDNLNLSNTDQVSSPVSSDISQSLDTVHTRADAWMVSNLSQIAKFIPPLPVATSGDQTLDMIHRNSQEAAHYARKLVAGLCPLSSPDSEASSRESSQSPRSSSDSSSEHVRYMLVKANSNDWEITNDTRSESEPTNDQTASLNILSSASRVDVSDSASNNEMLQNEVSISPGMEKAADRSSTYGAVCENNMTCVYDKNMTCVYDKNMTCVYDKNMTCVCDKNMTCVYDKNMTCVYDKNMTCIYDKNMTCVYDKNMICVYDKNMTCVCDKNMTCVCQCLSTPEVEANTNHGSNNTKQGLTKNLQDMQLPHKTIQENINSCQCLGVESVGGRAAVKQADNVTLRPATLSLEEECKLRNAIYRTLNLYRNFTLIPLCCAESTRSNALLSSEETNIDPKSIQQREPNSDQRRATLRDIDSSKNNFDTFSSEDGFILNPNDKKIKIYILSSEKQSHNYIEKEMSQNSSNQRPSEDSAANGLQEAHDICNTVLGSEGCCVQVLGKTYHIFTIDELISVTDTSKEHSSTHETCATEQQTTVEHHIVGQDISGIAEEEIAISESDFRQGYLTAEVTIKQSGEVRYGVVKPSSKDNYFEDDKDDIGHLCPHQYLCTTKWSCHTDDTCVICSNFLDHNLSATCSAGCARDRNMFSGNCCRNVNNSLASPPSTSQSQESSRCHVPSRNSENGDRSRDGTMYFPTTQQPSCWMKGECSRYLNTLPHHPRASSRDGQSPHGIWSYRGVSSGQATGGYESGVKHELSPDLDRHSDVDTTNKVMGGKPHFEKDCSTKVARDKLTPEEVLDDVCEKTPRSPVTDMVTFNTASLLSGEVDAASLHSRKERCKEDESDNENTCVTFMSLSSECLSCISRSRKSKSPSEVQTDFSSLEHENSDESPGKRETNYTENPLGLLEALISSKLKVIFDKALERWMSPSHKKCSQLTRESRVNDDKALEQWISPSLQKCSQLTRDSQVNDDKALEQWISPSLQKCSQLTRDSQVNDDKALEQWISPSLQKCSQLTRDSQVNDDEDKTQSELRDSLSSPHLASGSSIQSKDKGKDSSSEFFTTVRESLSEKSITEESFVLLSIPAESDSCIIEKAPFDETGLNSEGVSEVLAYETTEQTSKKSAPREKYVLSVKKKRIVSETRSHRKKEHEKRTITLGSGSSSINANECSEIDTENVKPESVTSTMDHINKVCGFKPESVTSTLEQINKVCEMKSESVTLTLEQINKVCRIKPESVTSTLDHINKVCRMKPESVTSTLEQINKVCRMKPESVTSTLEHINKVCRMKLAAEEVTDKQGSPVWKRSMTSQWSTQMYGSQKHEAEGEGRRKPTHRSVVSGCGSRKKRSVSKLGKDRARPKRRSEYKGTRTSRHSQAGRDRGNREVTIEIICSRSKDAASCDEVGKTCSSSGSSDIDIASVNSLKSEHHFLPGAASCHHTSKRRDQSPVDNTRKCKELGKYTARESRKTDSMSAAKIDSLKSLQHGRLCEHSREYARSPNSWDMNTIREEKTNCSPIPSLEPFRRSHALQGQQLRAAAIHNNMRINRKCERLAKAINSDDVGDVECLTSSILTPIKEESLSQESSIADKSKSDSESFTKDISDVLASLTNESYSKSKNSNDSGHSVSSRQTLSQNSTSAPYSRHEQDPVATRKSHRVHERQRSWRHYRDSDCQTDELKAESSDCCEDFLAYLQNRCPFKSAFLRQEMKGFGHWSVQAQAPPGSKNEDELLRTYAGGASNSNYFRTGKLDLNTFWYRKMRNINMNWAESDQADLSFLETPVSAVTESENWTSSAGHLAVRYPSAEPGGKCSELSHVTKLRDHDHLANAGTKHKTTLRDHDNLANEGTGHLAFRYTFTEPGCRAGELNHATTLGDHDSLANAGTKHMTTSLNYCLANAGTKHMTTSLNDCLANAGTKHMTTSLNDCLANAGTKHMTTSLNDCLANAGIKHTTTSLNDCLANKGAKHMTTSLNDCLANKGAKHTTTSLNDCLANKGAKHMTTSLNDCLANKGAKHMTTSLNDCLANKGAKHTTTSLNDCLANKGAKHMTTSLNDCLANESTKHMTTSLNDCLVNESTKHMTTSLNDCLVNESTKHMTTSLNDCLGNESTKHMTTSLNDCLASDYTVASVARIRSNRHIYSTFNRRLAVDVTESRPSYSRLITTEWNTSANNGNGELIPHGACGQDQLEIQEYHHNEGDLSVRHRTINIHPVSDVTILPNNNIHPVSDVTILSNNNIHPVSDVTILSNNNIHPVSDVTILSNNNMHPVRGVTILSHNNMHPVRGVTILSHNNMHPVRGVTVLSNNNMHPVRGVRILSHNNMHPVRGVTILPNDSIYVHRKPRHGRRNSYDLIGHSERSNLVLHEKILVSLHARLSVRLSARLSVRLSARLPVRLSARLSVRLSARLSGNSNVCHENLMVDRINAEHSKKICRPHQCGEHVKQDSPLKYCRKNVKKVSPLKYYRENVKKVFPLKYCREHGKAYRLKYCRHKFRSSLSWKICPSSPRGNNQFTSHVILRQVTGLTSP